LWFGGVTSTIKYTRDCSDNSERYDSRRTKSVGARRLTKQWPVGTHHPRPCRRGGPILLGGESCLSSYHFVSLQATSTSVI